MRHRLSGFFLLLLFFCGIPYIVTTTIHKDSLTPAHQSGYVIKVGEKTMDLEEYLIGILPTQMSLRYHPEALKAQAVVLRTDLVQCMGKEKLIDQSRLPYTYQSEQVLKNILGNKTFQWEMRNCRKAVVQTRGKVLTYKGTYIKAYYHGCSAGSTLGAREWTGTDIPYLQRKDSLNDVEDPAYMQSKIFSYEETAQRLSRNRHFSVSPKQLEKSVHIKDHTAAGYVKSVQAGIQAVSGEDWRKIFGLKSVNFYLEPYHGKIRMISLGRGSGLGMSQYGANEMAKAGKSYKKVLKYYFTNVTLSKLQ